MPHAAGIVLVLTSATAFGSFGVPIKSKRVLEAQVPPLCLLTSATQGSDSACAGRIGRRVTPRRMLFCTHVRIAASHHSNKLGS